MLSVPPPILTVASATAGAAAIGLKQARGAEAVRLAAVRAFSMSTRLMHWRHRIVCFSGAGESGLGVRGAAVAILGAYADGVAALTGARC